MKTIIVIEHETKLDLHECLCKVIHEASMEHLNQLHDVVIDIDVVGTLNE